MDFPNVIATLVAGAVAVLVATWSNSPVRLPLPAGKHTHWLNGAAVLGTAAVIGILSTWYMDCSQLRLLTIVMGIAVLLCIALLVLHYHLLKKLPNADTLIIVICLGWSISGTVTVSALATMKVAKNRMDAAYNKNPLVLWENFGGQKRKLPSTIFVPAGLQAHFLAEMDDCHSDAEWSLKPPIGEVLNGTYHAPTTVTREQQITVTAKSSHHDDTKSATVMLQPDSPGITRRQYPTHDKQGRPAVIDLIIISKSNAWVYMSEEHVERLSEDGVSTDDSTKTRACKPILDLAGSDAFDRYADVIAVGTASREGSEDEEAGRAAERSKRIAEWVNLALRNRGLTKHVYTMNLGQYKARDRRALTPRETARERPLVLIGVVRAGEIDLETTLRQVIDQHQNDEFFKFLTTYYPRRDVQPYAEVSQSACP